MIAVDLISVYSHRVFSSFETLRYRRTERDKREAAVASGAGDSTVSHVVSHSSSHQSLITLGQPIKQLEDSQDPTTVVSSANVVASAAQIQGGDNDNTCPSPTVTLQTNFTPPTEDESGYHSSRSQLANLINHSIPSISRESSFIHHPTDQYRTLSTSTLVTTTPAQVVRQACLSPFGSAIPYSVANNTNAGKDHVDLLMLDQPAVTAASPSNSTAAAVSTLQMPPLGSAVDPNTVAAARSTIQRVLMESGAASSIAAAENALVVASRRNFYMSNESILSLDDEFYLSADNDILNDPSNVHNTEFQAFLSPSNLSLMHEGLGDQHCTLHPFRMDGSSPQHSNADIPEVPSQATFSDLPHNELHAVPSAPSILMHQYKSLIRRHPKGSCRTLKGNNSVALLEQDEEENHRGSKTDEDDQFDNSTNAPHEPNSQEDEHSSDKNHSPSGISMRAVPATSNSLYSLAKYVTTSDQDDHQHRSPKTPRAHDTIRIVTYDPITSATDSATATDTTDCCSIYINGKVTLGWLYIGDRLVSSKSRISILDEKQEVPDTQQQQSSLRGSIQPKGCLATATNALALRSTEEAAASELMTALAKVVGDDRIVSEATATSQQISCPFDEGLTQRLAQKGLQPSVCSLALKGFSNMDIIPLARAILYSASHPNSALASTSSLSPRQCHPIEASLLHRLLVGRCQQQSVVPNPGSVSNFAQDILSNILAQDTVVQSSNSSGNNSTSSQNSPRPASFRNRQRVHSSSASLLFRNPLFEGPTPSQGAFCTTELSQMRVKYGSVPNLSTLDKCDTAGLGTNQFVPSPSASVFGELSSRPTTTSTTPSLSASVKNLMPPKGQCQLSDPIVINQNESLVG